MDSDALAEMGNDLQCLRHESSAICMVLIALVKAHPDRPAFARELRLLAGDLQVAGSAQGIQMPGPTRGLLDLLLRTAEE